jgi:hypothetical protein
MANFATSSAFLEMQRHLHQRGAVLQHRLRLAATGGLADLRRQRFPHAFQLVGRHRLGHVGGEQRLDLRVFAGIQVVERAGGDRCAIDRRLLRNDAARPCAAHRAARTRSAR